MIRFLRWTLGILFLATQFAAQATNWYVDNVATGSNTGTSWANAWSSFASIKWGYIYPGDNLFISGGSSGSSKTYTEVLQIGASGSASAPIRIGLDASNSSHNGTVILNGSYIYLATLKYVTISGNVGGQRHMLLSNYFSTSVATWGNKIVADSTVGFTLEYCSFNNVNQMVSLLYATGFKIQYCTGTDIRGDAAIRAVNSSGGYDSSWVQYNDITLSRNATTGGPDGVQASNGVTIRYNVFHENPVTYATSSQHPDYCQITGNYIQIYGNEFINIGDSGVDMDWWNNPAPHDIWIFNNVFRITTTIDPYPEYIRWYCSGGNAFSSLSNLKILNNTFIDDTDWAAITGSWGAGTPTVTGLEIKNNIFVNSGAYSIVDNPGLTSSSISFANNVYSGTTSIYRGIKYTDSTWSAIEPNRIAAMPAFVSYSLKNPANNLHLTSTDTAAVNHGLNFFVYGITADKDGAPRPATGVWDIGAYELAGSGGTVLPPPTVSAGPDQSITLPTSSVTLTGTASDPAGQSLTVAWSQVSGPAAVSFGSPAAVTSSATFPVAGSYSVRLTATAGGTRVASDDAVVTVLSQATQTTSALINFEAESGQISAPFIIGNGFVYQAIDTTVSGSGRAAYTFTAPVTGNYVINAVVSATTEANNSFYVNIDGEPTDPLMIWDIHPFTSGFQTRQVSWRGTGNYAVDQYTPKVFSLTAGQHTLIIRGRENTTLIDKISIAQTSLALPPSNVNVVTSP